MATVRMIEYEEASPEVREVYDDIMAFRGSDWINNFWKVVAVNPVLMRNTWEHLKAVMESPSLDLLTKELIYIAVSATNGSEYGVTTNTAAARALGMTDEMLFELMAVVGIANQTNALASGYQIEVDPEYRDGHLRR